MNNKLSHKIKIGAITLSALLALGACTIRTSENSQDVSSDHVVISSENNPISSEQLSTESSIQTPSSSDAPVSSSQEQISSSEAPSSSEQPVVTLVGIEAINNKESYEYGESLDLSVIAFYSDGTSEGLNEFDVAGFDNTISGIQTLIVSYEGKTTTIDVYVKPRVNLFPMEQLSSFLFDNEVLLEVPSPVGYDGWTSSTGIDNQKMPMFQASTTDDGVYTSYAALLVEDGSWTIDENSNAAIKENVKLNYFSDSGVFYFEAHILDLDPHSTVDFPVAELQEFLTANSLTASIPVPTSNHRWHYETGTDADLGNYFYTVTDDDGTASVDAIEDSYLLPLGVESWEIDDTKYAQEGYYAIKDDVVINFYTADGHFAFYAYEYIEPEYPITDEFGEWRLVTDVNTLNEGDHIVIGEQSKGAVAGNFNSNYMKAITGVTFADNAIRNLPEKATQFILHKNGSYWTLNNNRRKLGASGEKKIALDSGSTDWNISINGGKTYITNSNEDYGTIAITSLNVFTTYTSGFNTSSRILAEIYRFVELVPTYPTAINLTTDVDTISVGKTTNINVSYLPVDTNIKNNLVWSSSNEAVATVDNGVVKGIAEGTAVISLSADGEDGQPVIGSITITVSLAAADAWTIMMYVCGSDLESRSGLASADIDEILSVGGQPDDINIILETGGSSSWTNSQISPNNLGRFHVENKTLVKDTTISKANMGKAATFTSFMNWGLDNYPAQKIGVIFWNHGGGLSGVCSDENYSGDSLLNSEVNSALSGVFASRNMTEKLEFVGYDACLMGLQDVASFNSRYFNYMVGSEEVETGYGWAYNGWLGNLYSYKNTETVLKSICDSFISSCNSEFGSSSNDQTLAVYKLSEMSAYRTAFESFASAIKSTAKSNLTSFKNILKTAKSYANEMMSYSDYQYYVNYYGYPSEWFITTTYYGQTVYVLLGCYEYGTLDAYDVLTKIKADANFTAYTSQIDAAQSALNNLVLYNKIGAAAGQSHGIALHAKMSSYVSYPSEETDFTNWRSIFA